MIVDYRGLSEILRRNGDVAAIHCDVVGVNDEFEIRYGSRGILDHVPNVRDRGQIYCAYSWIKLPNGAEEYDVMSVEEIEAVRKRSRTPNQGPWVTDWNEMAKKTVFRRHAKMLPLSPQTREALERESDGDSLSEQERFNAATPVKASVLEEPKRPRGRPPKQSASQSAGEMPPETPQTAQDASEPQSAISEQSEAQNASETLPGMAEPMHEQVLNRVLAAGYSEAEMISMLKKRRIITTDEAASTSVLAHVKPRGLSMCLENWENVLVLLEQQRQGKL